MNAVQPLMQRGRAAWAGLAPREQRLVGGAALLVGLALLWWVGLSPALRTLRAAPAEHARLDAQLQQMQTLAAQAQALQAQPRIHREEALRTLESSVRDRLGPNTQVQPSAGDAVGVSMRGAPAETLGEWFSQVRTNARAVPREVHLTRSQIAPPGASGAPANPAANPAGATANRNRPASPAAGAPAAPPDDELPRIRWDGTLVLGLPAQ